MASLRPKTHTVSSVRVRLGDPPRIATECDCLPRIPGKPRPTAIAGRAPIRRRTQGCGTCQRDAPSPAPPALLHGQHGFPFSADQDWLHNLTSAAENVDRLACAVHDFLNALRDR